jgi:hypothetical protein
MSGCSLKIKTAKQWENHYLTVEELEKVVPTIHLDEDESIWLISNDTLRYILKK